MGADVSSVARGIGLDPRIGAQFLSAGIGFGGYCFPKDLRAFIHLGEQNGVECGLLREVEHINKVRIDKYLKKLREALWIISGKTIGVLGLAFKPQTDDIREAPSLKVVRALLREGANLRLYDPGRITYCASAYEAARGAQALAILTEWDEFGTLDLAQLYAAMEVPIIVDGRNMYDPEAVRNQGFEYHGIGRKTAGHAIFPSSPLKPVARRRAALTAT